MFIMIYSLIILLHNCEANTSTLEALLAQLLENQAWENGTIFLNTVFLLQVQLVGGNV